MTGTEQNHSNIAIFHQVARIDMSRMSMHVLTRPKLLVKNGFNLHKLTTIVRHRSVGLFVRLSVLYVQYVQMYNYIIESLGLFELDVGARLGVVLRAVLRLVVSTAHLDTEAHNPTDLEQAREAPNGSSLGNGEDERQTQQPGNSGHHVEVRRRAEGCGWHRWARLASARLG